MSAFVVAALCWPFVTFMLYNARTIEKYAVKNILPRELLSLPPPPSKIDDAMQTHQSPMHETLLDLDEESQLHKSLPAADATQAQLSPLHEMLLNHQDEVCCKLDSSCLSP